MVFSSTVFLFAFLPVVLLCYFLAPRPLRNLVLLTASLFFYAWGEGAYVALMLSSIALNYLGGIAIASLPRSSSRKLALGLAVTANLLLLGAFKYANFIVDNLNSLLLSVGAGPWQLDPVHLPIGISFFTFQAMSYVIDVYRGEAEVQRNPVNSALYIALFPQLIAGPIVRYHDIARDLTERRVSRELFASGTSLFIVGLGKKMLLANPLGEVADEIFALPVSELSPATGWLGAICYGLQIYFDFSGYSDMAIGLGRMFGFRFLINFNYPYIAQSMREFWHRWHISLSRWFRDYLYIPLGGSRDGAWRTWRNLLLVFLLCGLWHGASWNFVVWGLIHGLFLGLERTRLGVLLAALWTPLRHLYVLLIVTVAWVFFRTDDLAHAEAFLDAMFGGVSGDGVQAHLGIYLQPSTIAAFIVAVVGSTPLLPWVKQKLQTAADRPAVSATINAATLMALALIVLAAAMHLAAGTHNPFIYFRF